MAFYKKTKRESSPVVNASPVNLAVDTSMFLLRTGDEAIYNYSFSALTASSIVTSAITATTVIVYSGFSAGTYFSGTTPLTDIFVISGQTIGTTGHALFKEKSGSNLLFKSLVEGSNITLTSTQTGITISSTGGGTSTPHTILPGLNTYTGGTYSAQTVNVSALTIDSLTVSGNTNVSGLTATTIHSGSTPLDNLFVTEGYHLGEHAIYTGKTGSILRFKGLRAGTGISITSNSDSLLIDNTVSIPGGAYLWTTGTALQAIRANNGSTVAGGAFSIVGGKSNETSSAYSAILNGSSNLLSKGTFYSLIGCGGSNTISYSNFANIITGKSCKIYRSALLVSNYSSIIAGSNNTIQNSNASTILNGVQNIISGTTQLSFSNILGGRANKIFGEKYSFIGNGRGNFINGNYSFNSILNGSGQTIYRCVSSSILAGSGHTVDSVSNSAIIGGQNYTLTTANTVLVPLLRIANLPSFSASYNLVADSSGNVFKTSFTGGTGEANTASNKGTGHPVFIQKTGVDLEFRSLIPSTGIAIISGATSLTFSYTGTNASSTAVQPGINTFTGGTALNPTVNVTGGSFVNMYMSGDTILSGTSSTFGSTVNTWVRPFFFANGTTQPHIANAGLTAGISFVNSTATITGSLSATSISATTYFSGSTPLSQLLGGSSTNINGTNTYTGGTSTAQSINVSALTINTLNVSGNTSLGITSASTFSATTMVSGSTNLYNIFQRASVFPTGMMVLLYNNENANSGTATNLSAFTWTYSGAAIYTQYKIEADVQWTSVANINSQSTVSLWYDNSGIVVESCTLRADATGAADQFAHNNHISYILNTALLKKYGISITQVASTPSWIVSNFRVYGII